MILKFLALCLVCCLAIIITPIQADAAKKKKVVKVTSVKITNISNTYTLKKGRTKTIKVKISPSNATNKKLKWSSSNTKVAKVNSKGKVTAVKNGTAVITATAKDGSKKKVSCNIIVGTPVTSVKFSNADMAASLPIGNKFVLKVAYSPAAATTKAVKWSSSNTKVAKVTRHGTVTGIAKGTATITATATDGTKKYTSCKIKVVALVKSVKIANPASNSFVQKGTEITFETTISPTTANNKKVNWSSSNTSVATVSSKGVVKAVANGTTVIKATSTDGSNKSNSYRIQVISLTASSTNFVAHRGFKSMAPENSLSAFKLACEAGYWGVECDIWETTDQEFAISHDESLLRMCGNNVKITNLTLEEVQKNIMTTGSNIDQYPDEHIPSLREYLEIIAEYPNITPIIELKQNFSDESLQRLLDLLNECGVRERVTISSFTASNLTTIKTLDIPALETDEPSDSEETDSAEPNNEDETPADDNPSDYIPVTLQYLATVPTATKINWCIKNSINISTNYNYLTQDVIDTMHENGLKIGVYTVDDFFTAFNYIKNMGVDFLTSNYKLFD